jgi:hypothetical protein
MERSYHLRPRPSDRMISFIMSDERDKKEDPAEELKQGLTHLWKAARGVATEVKKEVERTDFGRELSGAGRELVRAAANVVDRIADEVGTLAKSKHADEKHEGPPQPSGSAVVPPDAPPDADEFDGVKPKPTGPTTQDPGFRIAVDEDEKKKGS